MALSELAAAACRVRRARPHRLAVGAAALATITAVAVLPAQGASANTNPLGNIPKSVLPNYAGYQIFSRVYANPYAGWKPPAAPWKFCESTSYSGNTWEQGTQAEYAKLVNELKAMGEAKGSLTVTDSNGTTALQISQLNSLVSEGCNVIFSVPGSPTAMCNGIANAESHGVLFITDDTPIYCKDGINVSFNGYEATYVGAKAVVAALHGKGNIIAETGIPGAVGTLANDDGLDAAIKGHSGITLLGKVVGDWTGSVAQTATAQFLATHPQTINGIVDFGAMGVSAELALQQAGRPYAVVNSFEASCSELAFAKAHPSDVAVIEDQAPYGAAWETFDVALRMLNGEQPVANTLFYPIPGPTQATIGQWYKPSMTIKSTCFSTPPNGRDVPDSYFNPLFKGGKPLTNLPKP